MAIDHQTERNLLKVVYQHPKAHSGAESSSLTFRVDRTRATNLLLESGLTSEQLAQLSLTLTENVQIDDDKRFGVFNPNDGSMLIDCDLITFYSRYSAGKIAGQEFLNLAYDAVSELVPSSPIVRIRQQILSGSLTAAELVRVMGFTALKTGIADKVFIGSYLGGSTASLAIEGMEAYLRYSARTNYVTGAQDRGYGDIVNVIRNRPG